MQKNNKLAAILILSPLSAFQCPHAQTYVIQEGETDPSNPTDDAIQKGTTDSSNTIYDAIQKGNTAKVHQLLRTTPQDIRLRDKKGNTPLLYAIQQSQWSIALQLIELYERNGINMVNHLKIAPLHAALGPNIYHTQERGSAQQTNVSKEERVIQLQKKLDTLRKELVAILLKKGADVNAVDYKGESPLFKAATLPSEACVKLLLEQGAKPNTMTNDGQNILHPLLKPREKNTPPLDLIKMLSQKLTPHPHTLNHPAGPQQATALHWAAGFCSQLLEIVIDAGANGNIPDALGDRPLHYVVGRFKHTSRLKQEQETDICLSIDLLVKSGIDIDAPNTVGDTALHIATKGGNEAICTKLLQYGAKASLKNKEGDTALHIAECSGNKVIYQKLLQYCNDNPSSSTGTDTFSKKKQDITAQSLLFEPSVKKRRNA